MTLYDMRLSLCRKLGYSESPAQEVSNRLDGFLNEIHQRVLGLPGMAYVRQASATLTTVASTAQYSLPPDVARVVGIRDATNDGVLRGQSFEWYQQNEPDPTSNTGIPEVWVPIGQVAYSSQPSSATALYVVGGSTDICTCYVQGTITGGTPITASVTLTGATAVQVGSWVNFVSITKFAISDHASRTGVTLREGSGVGTVLSTIGQGRTSARYLRIALWPTPSSALSLTLDYLRHIEDLTETNDEPLIPPDFHWVIEAGARMLEYEKQDDRRYPTARAEYEKGLRDLKWFMVQQADGRDASGGRSQLGPWYPAGS
jgi:hypothetical protein